MSLTTDKKRWDDLHAALAKAEETKFAFELELARKYGAQFECTWLSKGQKTKLEALQAKKDKISDKLFELITRVSPRDWSTGVPLWWVVSELTWEDATRPKSEPLSVVVPGSYGNRDGYVKEGIQMSRKTSKSAEAAGAAYAKEQIDSDYFMDWVRDQLLEASKMPPSDVLPLEDKHDAGIIAKNMLQQLEWDTKKGLGDREMKDLIGADVTPSSHGEFYQGFRKTCVALQEWLADELLTIKGEMGGGGMGVEAPHGKPWPDWMILQTIERGDMLAPASKDRAWDLVDLGYIDASGTWKLTLKGERALERKVERAPAGVSEARKVDPLLWYIDGYKGETRIRTIGPYSSKKEATTAARGKTGIEWGDPYQGMDMGHSGGVGEARTVRADRKPQKFKIGDKVESGYQRKRGTVKKIEWSTTFGNWTYLLVGKAAEYPEWGAGSNGSIWVVESDLKKSSGGVEARRAHVQERPWVPPSFSAEGITPIMLECLLYGMGEHPTGKVPRAGDSVVYDREGYIPLEKGGYIVLKRKTPGLSSFGDYYVLTDKGADLERRYRLEVRKIGTPSSPKARGSARRRA